MPLLNRLIPFVIAGIMLAIFAFGLILLAYLFLIGTVLGIILFAINWIRARFVKTTKKKPLKPSGRVIDSDDWRKL